MTTGIDSDEKSKECYLTNYGHRHTCNSDKLFPIEPCYVSTIFSLPVNHTTTNTNKEQNVWICRNGGNQIRRWLKKRYSSPNQSKQKQQCIICESSNHDYQPLLTFSQRQEFQIQCHLANKIPPNDHNTNTILDVCINCWTEITTLYPSNKCSFTHPHNCSKTNGIVPITPPTCLVPSYGFACGRLYHSLSTTTTNSNSNRSDGVRNPPKVYKKIDGLRYIPNFITQEEHDLLVKIIDGNEYSNEIHRRQQFYGELYYHTSSDLPSVQPSSEEQQYGNAHSMQPMQFLIDKLIKANIFEEHHPPTQCLINEYVGNQGIKSHYDDSNAFGPIIASISLIDPILFTLKYPKVPTNECNDILDIQHHLLEPKSLFIMERDARYKWRHSITKAKSFLHPKTHDIIHRDANYRRISITIRHVLDGRKRSS